MGRELARRMVSQVLAFYPVPGGTARICLCEDGRTRVFVEDEAREDGVVFLKDRPPPEDDE